VGREIPKLLSSEFDPSRTLHNTRNRTQQAALTSAVRAENRKNFASSELEIDSENHRNAIIARGDAITLEDRRSAMNEC
jgi:hypothetical protein